jgi:hypothetical protein
VGGDRRREAWAATGDRQREVWAATGDWWREAWAATGEGRCGRRPAERWREKEREETDM